MKLQGINANGLAPLLKGLQRTAAEHNLEIVSIHGFVSGDGFEMRAIDSNGNTWALKSGNDYQAPAEQTV